MVRDTADRRVQPIALLHVVRPSPGVGLGGSSLPIQPIAVSQVAGRDALAWRQAVDRRHRHAYRRVEISGLSPHNDLLSSGRASANPAPHMS